MRIGTTRTIAALAAALVMLLAASASASRLSYSEQRFRIIWTRLTFSESGGGLPIRCPVTLEGSFNSSTFAKTQNLVSGSIAQAAIGTCQEGNGSILRESLPWTVTYQSFTGTLPNITGVRYDLLGAAFQVEPGLGIVCLASTSETWPAAGNANRESGGNITSLSPDPGLQIPITGSPQCPEFGIFSGGGEVFVQGSSERRVRLSLI